MKVKRTRPNDSTIINNLFTFATIVMVTITLVLYSTYIVKPQEEENNTSSQIEKLPCEKNINSKVVVKNHELLKKSIKAIEKGYYKINGTFTSIEKESLINSITSTTKLNTYLHSLLNAKAKDNLKDFLEIKYEIIEGSSTLDENNKLNAGTIVVSFRVNSKEIFFMRSNLKFLYENAIKKHLDCSIKVYKNYVQN